MIDLSSVDVIDMLERLGIRNVRLASGGREANYSCFTANHAHGDESPSASMNIETTAFNCLACHARGNAISFVAGVRQISNTDAQRWLRDTYGIEFAEPRGGSMMAELEARLAPPKAQLERTRPHKSWLSTARVDWDHELRGREVSRWAAYVGNRGFDATTLEEWEAGYDYQSDRITFPVYDLDGELVGIKGRSWRPDHQPKYLLLGDNDPNNPRLGFHPYEASEVVYGLHRRRDVRTAVLCYSPDTEVLTKSGWVAFPDLQDDVEVMQVGLDGIGSFIVPKARQEFSYQGNLVNIRSDWCDLLVTPDHRMLGRGPKGILGERSADRLPENFLMRPSCKFKSGDESESPSLDEVRLLVAWAADGCVVKRSPNRRCWNLKKQRKKDRLRHLLDSVGAKYRAVDQTGANAGWTMFWVEADSVQFLDRWMPRKSWEMSFLDQWSFDARSTAIEELQHWDGDRASSSIRFFTADLDQAEAVSAISSTVGWGCVLRVDDRPNRPEQNLQYVLNLSPRPERMVKRSRQNRIEFDGLVHCCTVETGWLLVRRNGKTVVSGNCEGEWNAWACSQVGVERPCAIGMSYTSLRHVQLLAREVDEVVVFFDPDAAGRSGAWGAKNEDGTPKMNSAGLPSVGAVDLLEPYVNVRVVEGHEYDPAEYIRRDRGSEIIELVESARSSLEIRMQFSLA